MLDAAEPLGDPARALPHRRPRSGRVRNLTDFGAFVEVEDGVDGLVHVSDISWNKRIKHPGEDLEEGSGDRGRHHEHRFGEPPPLALDKDIEPSAWEKFISEHKPGDIVHGKITRFANFGAFVELAEGLEGLCHVSELSEDRVERPEDAAQIGQEMEFRILRIEQESKKIGLSHRAAKTDEPIMDGRVLVRRGRRHGELRRTGDFFRTKSTASAPAAEPAAAASRRNQQGVRRIQQRCQRQESQRTHRRVRW